MKKLNSLFHNQKFQGNLILSAFFGVVLVVLVLTWNS